MVHIHFLHLLFGIHRPVFDRKLLLLHALAEQTVSAALMVQFEQTSLLVAEFEEFEQTMILVKLSSQRVTLVDQGS